MPLSEFNLIRRYFAGRTRHQSSVALGIGDDCALLDIPDGQQLAVTTDTMVEGTHFLPGTEPGALGHKLLAVNLSDLASMGAQPIAVLLALTLPSVDESWLAAFADGFLALAGQHHVDLIGGDTTKGALTLTVQALGLVPRGQALRRSGAQPGDGIYLSGAIGDAGLGLKIALGDYVAPCPEAALAQFYRPQPQIAIGLAIRPFATACIDVSDGVAADLGHILAHSQVGATLIWDDLPLSTAVQAYINGTGDALMPLTAGDDYQLCFTVKLEQADLVPASCHKIGVIEAQPGLRLVKNGVLQPLAAKGYEHFS